MNYIKTAIKAIFALVFYPAFVVVTCIQSIIRMENMVINFKNSTMSFG